MTANHPPPPPPPSDDDDDLLIAELRAAFDAEPAQADEEDNAILLARAINGAMQATAPDAAPLHPTPSSAPIPIRSRTPSRVVKIALPLAAAFAASMAMAAAVYVSRSSPPPNHDVPKTEPDHNVTPSPSPTPKPADTETHAMSVNDLPTAAAPAVAPTQAAAMTGSAADLFRDANAERRAGNTARAVTLYRALEAQYPNASEAQASRVSLGFLLLEKVNDARGALDQFDAFLKSSTDNATLAEEARVGRAMSLEHLGRTTDEKRAWEEVVSRHPQSLHLAHARERLRVLEASEE